MKIENFRRIDSHYRTSRSILNFRTAHKNFFGILYYCSSEFWWRLPGRSRSRREMKVNAKCIHSMSGWFLAFLARGHRKGESDLDSCDCARVTSCSIVPSLMCVKYFQFFIEKPRKKGSLHLWELRTHSFLVSHETNSLCCQVTKVGLGILSCMTLEKTSSACNSGENARAKKK